MIEDKHSYRDFKNADYISIAKSLSSNDWILTFNRQSADISTSLVQNSLIDSIHRFVPLKPSIDHRSPYPIWVSPKLKYFLFKKKTTYKKYKITGSIQDYKNINYIKIFNPINKYSRSYKGPSPNPNIALNDIKI